ncbi:KaiC domain protein, PAE1156 family [Lactococcus cremoris]|nr:KaiC domain protein, PAE1156 family [Lactococcus cremoris]
MDEKSENRVYREAKKRINMRKNGIHPSDYFEGWVVDYIDSSDTDRLSVEKLQEQLNTAKKALTNIKLRTERDELETYYVERNHDIRKDAIDALAAIGGDDE